MSQSSPYEAPLLARLFGKRQISYSDGGEGKVIVTEICHFRGKNYVTYDAVHPCRVRIKTPQEATP